MDATYDDDFYKVCQHGYAVDGNGQSVVALATRAASHPDFLDKRPVFARSGIAGAMEQALMTYEAILPAGRGPWLARYTDNHDEGRGPYRFGEGGTRAAMQVAFLSAHAIPFLLGGQEFGALNRPPIHERFGPCDRGRRVIVSGRTYEQSGIEWEGNAFARGLEHRREWYAFYQALIRLRRTTSELQDGSFVPLDVGERVPRPARTVVAFERRLSTKRVGCAVNLGAEPRRITADLFAGRRLWGGLEDGWLAAFSAVVTRSGA